MNIVHKDAVGTECHHVANAPQVRILHAGHVGAGLVYAGTGSPASRTAAGCCPSRRSGPFWMLDQAELPEKRMLRCVEVVRHRAEINHFVEGW